MLRRIFHRIIESQTRSALRRLSDRQLADIGMTRQQAAAYRV